MLSTNIFEFSGARPSFIESQGLRLASGSSLPDIAVLPETLLEMEMQRHGLSFDLSGVTRVVMRDPGATLQILRLAGEEYGDDPGRPQRIEDCISDFGMQLCLAAVERGAAVRIPNYGPLINLWEHAGTIAAAASLVAERMPGGLRPEHARLGGLLHVVGSLPSLLGWQGTLANTSPAQAALRLAERWFLPDFIRDMFSEAVDPGFDSRWSQVMDTAHHLAGVPMETCATHELATFHSVGA